MRKGSRDSLRRGDATRSVYDMMDKKSGRLRAELREKDKRIKELEDKVIRLTEHLKKQGVVVI